MDYLQAVDKIKTDYAYLLNQKIPNSKTNEIDSFDVITITPIKGGHGDYNWLDYSDLAYRAFLTNKECLILFVLNYKSKKHAGGMFWQFKKAG